MRIIEFVFRSIQGTSMPLDRWTGQPLLLVNTASECGFTPQYTKLQALWEEYRPAGLIVLGIPCNDFGAQEPGDESTIQDFCTSQFNVTFSDDGETGNPWNKRPPPVPGNAGRIHQ